MGLWAELRLIFLACSFFCFAFHPIPLVSFYSFSSNSFYSILSIQLQFYFFIPCFKFRFLQLHLFPSVLFVPFLLSGHFFSFCSILGFFFSLIYSFFFISFVLFFIFLLPHNSLFCLFVCLYPLTTSCSLCSYKSCGLRFLCILKD